MANLSQNKLIEFVGKFKSAEKNEFLNRTFSYLQDTDNEEKATALIDLVSESPSLQQDLANIYGKGKAKNEEEIISDEGLYFEPEDTVQGIIELKEKMESAKFIKATGADFAFTDVNKSKELQVSTRKFKKIVNIDYTLLTDEVLENPIYRNKTNNKLYLREVGAGATIKDLTGSLEEEGLALMNQPGFEELTYLGVAMVGGHGSGINIRPLADYIVSMNVLVFEGGNVVEKRIECASNKITNKSVYEQRTGIEVINDSDDLLNAFRVSVGSLGIVISYILQVQDFFYLKEKREFYAWDDLKSEQKIDKLLRKKELHSLHIWFNPYPYRRMGYPGKRTWCLISTYEYAQAGEQNKGNRGKGVQMKGIRRAGYFLLFAIEHLPSILPWVLHQSLKSCVNTGEYVLLKCHEALNFGTPNEADVDPTNCGIPYDKFEVAADELFKFLEDNYQDHPATSPLGFRFVSKGDGLLSAQYNRETCMIEFPLLGCFMDELKEKNMNTLLVFNRIMMEKYEGKPHWGQYIHEDLLRTKHSDIYKTSYERFRNIYQKYGKSKFSNYFTELIHLDN